MRILPELDYTSFVHLKSRGAHELLKEMLRCKNMDFDSLCGALVALNRTRYVHKLCLEVGLGPRMATIEAYGGRGLVRGMVTAQSSFARAERCVVSFGLCPGLGV